MAFGRPCATDTEAGAVTPAGLRSKQLASAYDMVPVSVLLRESGPTSWVVMDEAAAPVDAERAQFLLGEAYAVRTRAVAEKKAAVYKDMAEYAHKFADDLYERAMRQRSGLEL